MPLLGLGTWDLNGEECTQVVCEAIQLGYRLIDTAQMYGNEREVGEGIMQSGIPRSELFITTKLYRISNSYDKAKTAIDESLRNLKLEYIDLLLLHEPYAQGLQMYKALEEAYQNGKIRAIGISNYDEQKALKFIEQCSITPTVNQIENHIYYQKWELQKKMEAHHVKLQAWSPLAQGKEHVMKHPLLMNIGHKYSKTVPQIILRFLTQRGISVIPKSRRKSRLLENMDIFDFQLTDDEMQKIHSLDRNKTLFPWTEGF